MITPNSYANAIIEMTTIFDAAGPVNAPALVLVHGSVVTRKIWLPQLRGLSDVYRVIAPDLPGHGVLAPEPFTFTAAVQKLAELIDHEAKGRALVAGLSLGGYIAIELAAGHPDRVSGLLLSGCSFNFTGALGLYLKLVSGLMQRGWLKQSHAQAEEKTRRMFPPALADVAEAQLQAGVYPESLGPSFAEMAGKDFSIPLARYPGPGLILNGERDKASRRGEAKFVAAMQQGHLQVVQGAGHACNLDQPEVYNQAVRDFGHSTGWIV
jgi:pimeloyl-ACP methyl ester carboxylesterase